MKRLLAALLLTVLCFSAAGCGVQPVPSSSAAVSGAGTQEPAYGGSLTGMTVEDLEEVITGRIQQAGGGWGTQVYEALLSPSASGEGALLKALAGAEAYAAVEYAWFSDAYHAVEFDDHKRDEIRFSVKSACQDYLNGMKRTEGLLKTVRLHAVAGESAIPQDCAEELEQIRALLRRGTEQAALDGV